MQITREQTGNLTGTIKITVSPADYDDKVSKTLKDFQRQAKIPGFRPGHVPFGMIKKMYGGSVLADEINKLVSEKIEEYIESEQLDLIGRPIANHEINPDDAWEEGKDLNMAFDIAISPNFELKLDDSVHIEYLQILPDEKSIDSTINNLRERNGKLEEVQKANEHVTLEGSITELDENEKPVEGGRTRNIKFSIEKLIDKDLQKKLSSAEPGNTFIFNPRQLSGNDVDTTAMLGIAQEDLELYNKPFRFELTKVIAFVPAELNEDFYKTLFPSGEVTDEKGLRKQIEADLKASYVYDSDHYFGHTAQEKLLELIRFDMPDDFIKRWLIESNEGKLTAEQLETDYPKYRDSLRWQLIENKIIKQANIRVEDEEVKEYILDNYIQGWRSLAGDEEMKKRIDQIAENFMKEKPAETRRILDMLYGQRSLNYIKTLVSLDSKEVSYDEFLEMDAKKHE